jgi:hypothetical protein
LTAVTASTNELLALAWPSLTVSVIVAEPLWSGDGVSVTVRFELLPPNTMFVFATRAGLELDALNTSDEAGVSASPIVNAIGPMAVSSGVVRLVIVEIVGNALMLTIAEAELSAPTGSAVEELTDATFVREPLAVATTWMPIVAVAPLASEPSAQLTTLPLFVHVPWLELAPTKLNPDGNASVTVTLFAVFGPRLVIVRLNTTLPLTLVDAGKVVSPIARSADGALPEQQSGVAVVMLSRHPFVMLPESPD